MHPNCGSGGHRLRKIGVSGGSSNGPFADVGSTSTCRVYPGARAGDDRHVLASSSSQSRKLYNARLLTPRNLPHRRTMSTPPSCIQSSSCLALNSLRWWSQNQMSGFLAFHLSHCCGIMTTAEYPQIAHRTITPNVPASCNVYILMPALAIVARTNSWCMRKSLSAYWPLVELAYNHSTHS